MSLFGKKTTIYVSASISNNMILLKSNTRFKASYSETRIMMDKISSVTHSVIFGQKAMAFLSLGLVFLIVGMIIALVAATTGSLFGIVISVVGVIFLIVSLFLREHSIVVDCSGDVTHICVGKTQTDKLYVSICNILSTMKAGAPLNNSI